MYKGGATAIGRDPMVQRSVHVVDDDIDVRSSMIFFLSTQNLVGNAFESGRAFLDQVLDLGREPINGIPLLAVF